MFYRDLSKFTGVLFRLDGNDGVVGLGTHLTNLSRLMENSQDRYVLTVKPDIFPSAPATTV